MKDKQIKRFIEDIKLESTYKKFIKNDIIYQLINIFDDDFEKQSYSNEIENSLEMALQFYKEYNVQYYDIITKGIESERIIISEDNIKSFNDTQDNKTFIKLYGNDGDLFIIVHEFAHFIDKNSNPSIIPDEYWFLSETFAFYIEKKLEIWLENKKYKDLISTRINNRMYFESKMLKAIENELYYESLYKQKGKIEDNDIDIEKIKSIIKYDISSNIVNYLLQYPLANILSNFLISNNLFQIDKDFVKTCLSLDLCEVSKQYSLNQNVKKLNK